MFLGLRSRGKFIVGKSLVFLCYGFCLDVLGWLLVLYFLFFGMLLFKVVGEVRF